MENVLIFYLKSHLPKADISLLTQSKISHRLCRYITRAKHGYHCNAKHCYQEVGHTMDNGDSIPKGRNLILVQTLPYIG